MTEYDLLYASGGIVFICATALFAIYLEQRFRRATLRDFDLSQVCFCTHRGWDHNYWRGNCKHKTRIAGYRFECVCPGYRPVKRFSIQD